MDTNALHIKASEILADGEVEKAKEIYETILKETPNDEAALSALMDIYQDTDRLKYYIVRANYNIVNGKLEYGITDCKKALNIDASNIEAREKLARLYKITNKQLKEIDEFSKIIEINEGQITAYIELINLYTKEKELEYAINVAKKGNEIFGDRANFNDIEAKLYFDLGDYESALKVVSDETLKVKILLQDEKNDEAKEILDKLNPNEMEKERKALYFLLMAQYSYNTKNFDEAFKFIDEYTKILGPNPISFQMRALCYEEKGDDFMASYNYAYMNKSMGKFDEALVEFNNAYTLNPKNKDVLIELAKLYEANKEKYTAIDYWQKVYELDGDEYAKNILKDFYIKEGDFMMAQKYGAEADSKENGADSYSEPEEEDEGLLNKIINFFSKK